MMHVMKLLVSGSSGLVGAALCRRLADRGDEVHVLMRRATAAAREIAWDPERGVANPELLEGFDAVVHLAGEGIASGRWTRARKERIRSSRTVGTRVLAEALARVARKPNAFLCASAVGWYGNRGDERLDETSAPGTGFLAGVCREWEEACQPLARAGVRVANLRFGMILSSSGGALAKMLLPFRMGAGGRLGSGAQWMSWIALDDVVGAVEHVLSKTEIRGPVDFTAPGAVTNAEFTRVLARVLRRPAVLPAPAFALRLVLGEMADELLLASQRVAPAVLQRTSYAFAHPELEGALRHVLR
jgi:uncharacterized protein (TIGR01777 family)